MSALFSQQLKPNYEILEIAVSFGERRKLAQFILTESWSIYGYTPEDGLKTFLNRMS
jgi:hypothetical protein